MSRELTPKEVQDKFLDYTESILQYWLNESRCSTQEERMSGLVHSILVAIDGEAASLPAFKLVPLPHPDDKQFDIECGQDYYPTDVDIAGDLHDIWNRYPKKEG